MKYIDKRIWSLVLTIIILFNNVLSGYASSVYYGYEGKSNLEQKNINYEYENDDIHENINILKNINEELLDIRVLHPEQRKIIQNDAKNTEGFYGSIKDYDIYLRSADANFFDVSVRTSKSKHSVSIDGKVIKPVFGKYTDPYKIDNLINGQVVTINLMDGSNILSTYTINVHISSDASNDPHIYGQLLVDKKKNVSQIDIYAENIQFVTSNIKIDLKVMGTPSDSAFKGFSNKDGDVFMLGSNLESDSKNYYDLNKDVSIIEMSSNNGSNIEISMEKNDISSKYIDVTKPIKLITLYLSNNSKYSDTYNDITAIMEFDSNNTYASTGYKYDAIYDTAGANLEEEKKTFSYLVLQSSPVSMRMFIDHDSNDSRVKFEIYDHSKIPPSIVNTDYNSVINNEVVYYLEPGEYSVNVIANGYTILKSNRFTIDISGSKDGIIFYPINLLEGELDGDNDQIDASDLIKLLEILNEDVQTPGEGFAINGVGDKIYADYNDDDIINVLDLGRLLKNIGAKYKNENLSPAYY